MRDFADGDVDFVIVLEEVFGPRHEDFSERLRGFLKEMWCRGIATGVYARENRTQVPEEAVVPQPGWSEEAKRSRKMAKLRAGKESLVEMAETVAARIDNIVDLTPFEKLEGDDLTTAVHRHGVQETRIWKRLEDLLREVERFRLLDPSKNSRKP